MQLYHRKYTAAKRENFYLVSVQNVTAQNSLIHRHDTELASTNVSFTFTTAARLIGAWNIYKLSEKSAYVVYHTDCINKFVII